jgi:hypothetical protein
MKKLIYFLSATALITSLFLSSCSKTEDTAGPTTSSTDPRAHFIANWYNSETDSDGNAPTYYVNITDSSDASHILLGGLWGLSRKPYATTSGNNITIPAQTITGFVVSGSGVLVNANRLNINYLVKTTSTHWDTVTAVLTK